MPAPALRIDESQALWFRARRSHLAKGASTPVAAARAILGAQAQQEGPALNALSLRTTGRPTFSTLRKLFLEKPRLVRTWGQRDTLHVYDPADWRSVVAAIVAWPQTGRRGGMPPADLLAKARRRLRAAGRPVLRRDLFEMIPAKYVEELAAHPGVGNSAVRQAASRLIWLLAKEGVICLADKVGSEARYAPRGIYFPDLPWPDLETKDAVLALTRRYFATFGPATAADAAHFFGARVGQMKDRLAEIDDELTEVDCGDRKGLLALAKHRRALRATPPSGAGWPLRLLPQWDTHLMTHRDKSWVAPRADELPEIWRKAAVVAPAVLARGRIVATWKHRATKKKVRVEVSPLAGWRSKHQAPVELEARALARHLEVETAEVAVG